MDDLKKELKNKRICRFCMTQEEPLSNIYSRENRLNSPAPLPLQIMSCVSIEVFINDAMPSSICDDCRMIMEFCYRFKQICRKSDNSLRQFPLTGVWPKKSDLPKLSEDLVHKMYPKLNKKSSKIFSLRSADTKEQNLSNKVTLSASNTIQTTNKKNNQLFNESKQQQKSNQKSSLKPRLLNKSSAKILNKEAEKSSEPILSQPIIKTDSDGNVEIITEIIQEKNQEVDPIKNTTPVQTNVFPCEHCERIFPLRQLLEIHLINHNRERSFKCKVCPKSFFSKYDLSKHTLIHTGEKPFKCVACKKAFTRSTLLHRHQKIHTDEPKFLCVFCEKPFLSREELDKHSKRHQKNRPYVCKICNKAFAFKQGLERHETIHAKNQPYPCQYCESSFPTPSKLARHLTAHAGKRPFPCKLCPKSYLLSHHLTRHLRSHKQGEGSYKCYECAKIFSNRDALIYHSAVHATKTLVCPICKDSFENLNLVSSHIKNHADGEQFACEFCDLIFLTADKLKFHCDNEHTEDLAVYEEHDKNNEYKADNYFYNDESQENIKEEVIDEFIIEEFINNDDYNFENAFQTFIKRGEKIISDDNTLIKTNTLNREGIEISEIVIDDSECVDTVEPADDNSKIEEYILDETSVKEELPQPPPKKIIKLNPEELQKISSQKNSLIPKLLDEQNHLKRRLEKLKSKIKEMNTSNTNVSDEGTSTNSSLLNTSNESNSTNSSKNSSGTSNKNLSESKLNEKIKNESTDSTDSSSIDCKVTRLSSARRISSLSNLSDKRSKNDDSEISNISYGDRKSKVHKIILKKDQLRSASKDNDGVKNKKVVIKTEK